MYTALLDRLREWARRNPGVVRGYLVGGVGFVVSWLLARAGVNLPGGVEPELVAGISTVLFTVLSQLWSRDTTTSLYDPRLSPTVKLVPVWDDGELPGDGAEAA